MFFKMVDEMSKDYILYTHKDTIWLINSNTREWIISYYPKTKYAWWNYDFFKTVYKFLSMEMKERQPIRDWIELRMMVEVGENCEPDRIPSDYNWSSDFDVEEVINKGKVVVNNIHIDYDNSMTINTHKK